MIKVFEIWTPTTRAHEPLLELRSSYYGDLASFKAASAHVTFAPGVGLPGQVWASKRPILFADLADQSRFVRAKAAVAAGLVSGLGLPLFAGNGVSAVITLLCTGGVLEIWSPNAEGTMLTLRTGAYQGVEAFGAVSRTMTFAPGEGLPGQVWASKTPIIFPDLATAPAFVRKAAAVTAGLTAGLAIPIVQGAQVVDVVTLLSPQALPLAKVFALWSPAATQLERADPAELIRTEAAALAGLTAALGLPMLANGGGKATVVLLE